MNKTQETQGENCRILVSALLLNSSWLCGPEEKYDPAALALFPHR